MRANTVVRSSLGCPVLSQDQVEQIVLAGMEILERIGVLVFNEEALGLLRDSDAYVSGNRVHIPTSLVEAALSSAPRRVVLANRNGTRTLLLESSNVYFGLGADCPFIYDYPHRFWNSNW